MYNKTLTDWIEESKDVILNLSRFRMIDIGASLLFLLLIFGGRKLWLNVLCSWMFFEGIQCTFFPRMINFWVTGDLDDTHLLLVRCIGLMLMSWAFTYFLIGKSTDSTTQTSFLLSFCVTNLTSLLFKGYLLINPAKKSVRLEYEQMSTTFYVTLLMSVGTLFHTFKSNDWGGYGEQHSHANFHLRLQFVLLLFMGVICYAMPQWTVKLMGDVEKVDQVHAFFTRANGSLLLAMAMLSNRAANFLRNNDKDAVVFCQWLLFICVSVLGWVDTAGKWSNLEWSRIALHAFHDAVLILNATGALNRDISVIKWSVLPRFRAVPEDIRSFFKFKQI